LSQPNSGVSGKANRIGAYRKSNTFEFPDGEKSAERSRRRTYTSGKSPPVNNERETNEHDESFTAADRAGPDVKQAVQNLQETQQVASIIDKIELNYGKAKKKINGCDTTTLEADITAQTLNTCYNVVQGHLGQDNPNYDTEQMDHRLDQMLQKVRTSNTDYNRFKGEFFSVNEPIINKDILTLSLDRVERYLEKQEAVLSKLPPQEELVKENANQIAALKNKYQAFEAALFTKQAEETRYVIKDTEDLVEKIEQQIENLKNLVEGAQDNLQKVLPQTKEQRQKYQKIQQDLVQVEQKIEDGCYSLN
jgi:hypothetical protein